jgi:hypothetical protein
MSQVTISSNASGTGIFTIASPNSNTNQTLTLPDATGTAVLDAATQTLTNKTLGSGLVMSVSAITAGTAQATTSGTSIDFTGIPSWVKRITVMFSSLSSNGASAPQIQIGSTTFTTSGYLGAAMSGAEVTNNSSGFLLNSGTFISSGVLSGGLTLCNLSGNVWVSFGASGRSDIARGFSLGGVLTTLAGTLDRVRLTTVNGTDTFDAGTINILYE